MEQTKTLPPLVSDEQIRDTFMYGSLIKDEEHGFMSGANYVRHEYEADRAKTREVVQALVDAAKSAHHQLQNILDYRVAEGSDRDKVRAEQDIIRIAMSSAKSQLQIEPTK